jgi:predicted  nucleic acid-binding Zn-ribbon protein
MRKLLFESIWILSRKSRAARAIQFHPQKNLLLGRNHTGKSSLIKTLFVTLGATPSGHLEKWDYGVTSLIKLSTDGNVFHVLHQNGHRALLRENFDLVSVASTHLEWAEIFASAVGFNLVILDKNSESILADPRCFFLPFYINQDGSWQAKWDTFRGLEQYSKPVSAILEYFTGLKPPEYYKLSAERARILRRLDELQKEQRFLKKAWDRLSKKMSMAGPKLDSENFEKEIALLTEEVSELNKQQEILRDSAVREQEVLANTQLQIRLANDVLKTYDNDSGYLRSHPRETLVCPTCGAEHLEPFIDILTYAEDARVLRDLVTKLRTDSTKAARRIEQTRAKLKELEKNYGRVCELLETRRGALKLREVLDSIGAEQAFSAFEAEYGALKQQIEDLLGKSYELDSRLKALTDRSISKDILKSFRSWYSSALVSLNLPPVDMSRIKLTSRPQLSGSGGPRQMLAYYSALWNAALGKYGSFSVPLVIDAPNQQGQDDINLPAILSFIGTKLPGKAQVIIGSEIQTNHQFDQVISLEEPYAFLQGSAFDEVSGKLESLERRMFDELDKKS